MIREHVPGRLAHHRHHRRLPGRDRGGVRGDARGRRGGPVRLGLHVHLLAAPRDRGGRCSTASCRTRSSASGWSGSSRRCSAAPTSARSASSAGRWRCWSRARRAPTRRGCAAASVTTRRCNFAGVAEPGEYVAGRDRLRDQHDAGRATSACSPAWRLSRRRPRRRAVRADGRGQDGRRDRAGAIAALARGGSRRDLGRRPAGLPRAVGASPARRRQAEQARARAPADRLPPGHGDVLAPASSPRWRTRRSTPRWRRGGGRSWSAARASTCGPR